MWIKWIPLFVAAAMLECIGQISFKKAALEHREEEGMRYYVRLAGNKWTMSGMVAYGAETLLWIFLLSRIPLSIAFPLAGVQQLVILAASYVIMKERVRHVELLGAGLIACGLITIVSAG